MDDGVYRKASTWRRFRFWADARLRRRPAASDVTAERCRFRRYVLSIPRPVLRLQPNTICRIPAITHYRTGKTLLLGEVRPIPQVRGVEGAGGIGGAESSDLPNPNQIVYSTSRNLFKWSDPRPVPGIGPGASDPALVWDGENLTVLYVASREVGYFGSKAAGPRLQLWAGHGPAIQHLSHRRLDEIYEETCADGIFATSGSALNLAAHPEFSGEFARCAAFALVTRRGSRAALYVAYLRGGQVVGLSNPIVGPDPENLPLDEAAICYFKGEIHLSARIQGRGGRLHFTSRDGRDFTRSSLFAALDPTVTPNPPDPGCNACFVNRDGQLGLLHPHETATESAKECAAGGGDGGSGSDGDSAAVAMSGPSGVGANAWPRRRRGREVSASGEEILWSFGLGPFGYSDTTYHPGHKAWITAFERRGEIYLCVNEGHRRLVASAQPTSGAAGHRH